LKNKTRLLCPECKSSRIWKDGIRYTGKGEIQRYICRSCGFRFSESSSNSQVKVNIAGKIFEKSNPRQNFSEANIMPINFSIQPSFEDFSFKGSKDPGPHSRSKVTNPEKSLNNFRCLMEDRQESDESRRRAYVSLAGTRSLAEVSREEKRAAGATWLSNEIKGKLVEYAWWMKKEGYAESTIITRAKVLQVLAKRGADIFDPESVKNVISQQRWSEGRKANAVKAYTNFLKMIGGKWQPPICREVEKLPFIPTEKELDDLIATCTRKISVLLQLLKETGMRAGEAWQLKWTDLDIESQTIRVTPEKGSNPRIFKISNKLLAMMSRLPRKNDRIFGSWQLKNIRRTFQRQRNKLAEKLCNPRIKQITFHTFRHWKATMEYAKTKDILHVMQVLGHKNIKNTLKYTQLVCFKDDEFICKVAKTVREAKDLIEAGFEYVCEVEGAKLFRKRK